MKEKKIYLCIAADVIHHGHINLIKKAKECLFNGEIDI